MKMSQKGFTLMELLVVIAILTILMGLIAPKVGRMMDEAAEHKCRNNLKQLHVATISHVNDNNGRLPVAMSYELYDPPSRKYYEQRGWVSWIPPSSVRLNDRWPSETSQENGMQQSGGIGESEKFAIENGTLHPYMNASMEHYVCPLIKREINRTRKGAEIYRTYAMNRFFHSPRNPSWLPRDLTRIGTAEYFDNYKPEAAKLLLFAEVEPKEGTYTHAGADAATRAKNDERATDSIPGDCSIGPTEKNSKNDIIFSVHRSPLVDKDKNPRKASLAVFLDGHIEKVFSENSTDDNVAWFYARGLDPEETL